MNMKLLYLYKLGKLQAEKGGTVGGFHMYFRTSAVKCEEPGDKSVHAYMG